LTTWAGFSVLLHAGREGPILGDLRQQSFSEILGRANYAALRSQAELPLFSTCRRM